MNHIAKQCSVDKLKLHESTSEHSKINKGFYADNQDRRSLEQRGWRIRELQLLAVQQTSSSVISIAIMLNSQTE